MMSTPSSASLPAMRTFSRVVMLQPGACSPSRSVVSNMKTLDVAMRVNLAHRSRLGKFIIVRVSISVAYLGFRYHGPVELNPLHVFATVVSERSFSRAAEKLFRTQPAGSLAGPRPAGGVGAERSSPRAAEKLFRPQPAVSLAVQRLESELGEKLIDRDMRGARELVLTDAGRVVFEHARRFANLERELTSALAELRDRSAGRLTIGANESSTLYLLPHI